MSPEGAFTLWPRQIRGMRMLFEDGVDQLLYGGAAGGGKSEFIRALAYSLAEYWPGARIPIFRLTYPELHETHIDPWLNKMSELGFNLSRCWRSTNNEFRFPNKSIVEFRHIDQTLGARKWLSAEWAALLIDEATMFNPDDLRLLYSRVRRPKEGLSKKWLNWHPIGVYATNPGGRAHRYLKETFIDPAQNADESEWDAEIGLQGTATAIRKRGFLRAKLEDNPSLDSEYAVQLADLPEAERKRMLDGDWSYFEGQVYTGLQPLIHRFSAKTLFDEGTPPRDWSRCVSLDHGNVNPTAVTWTTRDEDGNYLVYREYYRPGPTNVHIDAIRTLLVADGSDGQAVIADPQMKRLNQSRDGAVISTRMEYQQGGVQLFTPASNAVIDMRQAGRLALMRLLDRDDNRLFPHWHHLAGQYGAPQLYIADECPNLWRELTNIRYIDGKEDTVKEDDHAYDTLWRGLPLFERSFQHQPAGRPRRILEAIH